LTKPRKMPGYSWSLPAGNVQLGNAKGMCPFAVSGADALGNAAICDGCYANPESVKKHHKSDTLVKRGGSYGYRSVREAQTARRDWTLRCLMTKEGQDEWVAVMVDAIRWATRTVAAQKHAAAVAAGAPMDYALPPTRSRRIPFFRVHDSGDMFSPQYAAMWQAVCEQLPDVRFWIPTRSYQGGAVRRLLPVLQTLNQLGNVAVRPSALHLNVAPPVVMGLSAGTGAAAQGYNCPSSSQGGACLDCRQCWGKSTPVTYRLH